jgi:formylglycine-generating enzyme required for sulfatase activity
MTDWEALLLLAHIPAGLFALGTSDEEIVRLADVDAVAAKWKARERFSREQPQQVVSLDEFRIAVHPITVGIYRHFVDSEGYRDSRFWLPQGWAWLQRLERCCPEHWDEEIWAGDPRLPVVGVSWFEAHAFCRWMSEEAGTSYRLPSEAQWEKAARGDEARIYPWGDDFDATRCNTRAAGPGRTLPVGLQGASDRSPYGCAEMAGNVSEWTRSLFRPYPYSATDGREDENASGERVTRGGSWFKPPIRSRCAARGLSDPTFSDTDLGFRVVLP